MKGKSLVGFLVLLTLAAAGRAQTQQTQPPAQTREIEWLVNQGTNYLLARSYASVQLDIKDTCTVAMLHRPKDCAWCDHFNRCLQQTPGLSAPFIAKVDNEVTLVRPTLDASTRSSAYHSAYFGPLSFRLSNRVITTYENRGEYQPSNRGIAEVSGEIFFRIPPGLPLNYELSGELQWAGGNSHVQLIGVANTGANSDGFSFNTNHLPKGVPAPLRKAGSLTPGVYRLFWFLTADQISHGGSSGASLDLQMRFMKTCDHPQLGPCYQTLEEAADAGLREAWRMSLQVAETGKQQEFGGYVYQIAPKDFRFVAPTPGKNLNESTCKIWERPDFTDTGWDCGRPLPVVTGNDMDKAFDAKVKPVLASQFTPKRVAIYHSHPPKIRPSYLSINDLNLAVLTGYPIYMIGYVNEDDYVEDVQSYTPGNDKVLTPMENKPDPKCGCYRVDTNNAARAQERGDERRLGSAFKTRLSP